MSTGAIASLISQQPYTFDGILVIGKIFAILDLTLFVLFTALIIARFCLTKGSFKRSLHHPHESFFFGCFWVSIALILYNIQQYGVPSAGPWLIKTLEVLFWVYAGCALLVAIFQYHVIFDEEDLPVVEAMPSWVLPGESSLTARILCPQSSGKLMLNSGSMHNLVTVAKHVSQVLN